MTMAEVLESIQGLGIRFDRHAARLKALEEETGMDSDPDDEDDEAKKAEEAMADDDDPDKDRGRSTRTPGVQAMGRAESRRAAKEKDKLARSGRYGNIGVNPNPGPSRNRDGDAGMNAGNMLRPATYKPFQLRISHFLDPVTTPVTTPVIPGISSRHPSC